MDVGVVIDKSYKVIEHIGRGGMADVWSARDTKLNRMVAIKTMAHGLSQDADPVSLFKDEAQTIAQIEHPHILPIYDYGEFEGQLYIVMRYVAGGSLEDMLNRGALPITEALRIGRAIGEALDYAHGNNIIHLDLKPPNVLMDSHASPYLADFGLATKLDPEGKARNPGSGTLLYMAPEQLTAELIDKRADIFSFSIMMFHMLTGQLPFQASVPLALKQIQRHEELPEIDLVNTDLPSAFTDILRRGTAFEPTDRPNSLVELIEEMREVVSTTTFAFAGGGIDVEEFDSSMIDPALLMTAPLSEEIDMELLEAIDIYNKARHNWGGGNGRFLLGVTHFMVMNGYYMFAEQNNLELDEAGKQMLLRGALEYDVEVDFWWNQLDDDNRRWVSLHALRSGNAPARVRSLYRLETLTDASPPQIPKLVAQALQVETNEEARIAALQVLGTRAKLLKPTQTYDIKTEYRGRMLTTMTRLGVQMSLRTEWQEVVYTPEIDLLIAETALDDAMPRVSEFAARIVGRMRSTTAVRYIANQQTEGRKGSLRALALIRDEAPTLPPVVSRTGRVYAWIANTSRRMFDKPMGIVFRYVAAAVGGSLAMGYNLNKIYSQLALLTQDRWANTIAVGLVFGVIIGFVPVFAGEFSFRLRRFWPWWGRIIAGMAIGTAVGVFAWWSWIWFYLKLNPGIDILVFGGGGIALGYMLTSLFNLRSWFAIPLTALLSYLPVYITFQVGWMYEKIWIFKFDEALLYYNNPNEIFSIALPAIIAMSIGGHFPRLLRDIGEVIMLYRNQRAARLAAAGIVPQEEVYAPPAVPDVRVYAAEVKAEQKLQPGLYNTELDPAAGIAGMLRGDADFDTNYDAAMAAAAERYGMQTEMDFNQGLVDIEDGAVTEPKVSGETQGMNIGTGLRIAPRKAQPADMHTELDPNRALFGDEDAVPKAPAAESLNIGTGLRIAPRKSHTDDLDMHTEIDPRRAAFGDGDETSTTDKPKAPAAESLNISTGLNIGPRRVQPAEMKTEFDPNRALLENEESTTDDSKIPATQSLNIGTGLRLAPRKSSELDTDVEARKTLEHAATDLEDSETPPQSLNIGTGLRIAPRKVSELDTDPDAAKKLADETQSRAPRFLGAKRAVEETDEQPSAAANLKTEIDPSAALDNADDTVSRAPRFFAAKKSTDEQPTVSQSMLTEADPGKVLEGTGDDTLSRAPRFFSAKRATEEQPIVSSNMLTEADPGKAPEGTGDDTQSRAPRFFSAKRATEEQPVVSSSMKTELEPGKNRFDEAQSEEVSPEKKPSDEDQNDL